MGIDLIKAVQEKQETTKAINEIYQILPVLKDEISDIKRQNSELKVMLTTQNIHDMEENIETIKNSLRYLKQYAYNYSGNIIIIKWLLYLPYFAASISLIYILIKKFI